MAADIIGLNKILKNVGKYDFLKIKVSKGGDVVFIDRARQGEGPGDILDRFAQWAADFIEETNFKEYTIELSGNDDNDPDKRLNPFLKMKVQFNATPEALGAFKAPGLQNGAAGISPREYAELAAENARLAAQLEHLEEKILQDQDDDEEEAAEAEQPATLGNVVTSLLMKHGDKIAEGLFLKLFSSPSPSPVTLAGTHTGTETLEEFRRIHPDIDDDLRRLLKLAQDNPGLFQMLIQQLRAL